MKEQIVFGDAYVEAELPADTQIVPPGVSLPLSPVDDLEATVRTSLENPIDTEPLRELVNSRSRILVAFDDPTVPCYAPMWSVGLKAILRALEAGGVLRENISWLCANALHRQFTHAELGSLIGDDLAAEFGPRLGCHDAEDPDGMVEIGTTSSGHVVDLNRRVLESDLTVYLNCSTTRGFSGGWKSICVGLSSYRSIANHHTPDVMSMSMGRNRMHEILDDMGALCENAIGRERFFKVETVLADPLQVAAVLAGSVGATRRAALDLTRANLSDRRDMLPEKVDVVLYGVPDWSPYAAFSFLNPILTMISTGLGYLGGMIEALGKPGCTAILATPCPDRWDEARHPSYKEVWDRVIPATRDPFEARERFEGEFATRPHYIDRYRNHHGFHGSHGVMALYPLKRLRHTSRVIVAGPESPDVVQHAGFTWAKTVGDALAEARGEHGEGCTVAFVRYPPAFNRQ